jgi:EXPERA (EXPanded EBP superfamily)
MEVGSTAPPLPHSLILHSFTSITAHTNVMCARIGFMTFAPEWLTGNQNLDGSNFMFLWIYLVFFNMLWVFLPIYAMYVSFEDMKNAVQMRKSMMVARAQMQKEKEEKSK